MATAQSPIFRLLRIYYFPTANIHTIYLLQIEQLFQNCKSSKYLITVHGKILWQLQIAYFEIFRRFIWQLRKAQFCGHCATIILLLRVSQLFMYCKSTNYFTTGNRLHNCLLCIEKFFDNFKSPISKHNDLYGYCAKYNFLATAHLSFSNCASPNYLSTANRPIISTLEIVWIFDYSALKSCMTNSHSLFRNISTIYMASAQSPISWLLRIIQLLSHCISLNYLSTANRPIISPQEIV